MCLNPIYSSPNDDNGYYISDYQNIMSEFGSKSLVNQGKIPIEMVAEDGKPTPH